MVRVRVDIRMRRLSLGNFGIVEPVGEGVSELKIDHGPGHKVYFVKHGGHYVVLFVGGEKSTQARDFTKAKQLARKYAEKRHDQDSYSSLGSRRTS